MYGQSDNLFGQKKYLFRYEKAGIFLHSVGLFKTLRVVPYAVAGHSLGEFSALVACEAISFEEALKIVRKRGLLMQYAGEMNPGTMAAVIGLEDVVVEQICIDASSKVGKIPADTKVPAKNNPFPV